MRCMYVDEHLNTLKCHVGFPLSVKETMRHTLWCISYGDFLGEGVMIDHSRICGQTWGRLSSIFMLYLEKTLILYYCVDNTFIPPRVLSPGVLSPRGRLPRSFT